MGNAKRPPTGIPSERADHYYRDKNASGNTRPSDDELVDALIAVANGEPFQLLLPYPEPQVGAWGEGKILLRSFTHLDVDPETHVRVRDSLRTLRTDRGRYLEAMRTQYLDHRAIPVRLIPVCVNTQHAIRVSFTRRFRGLDRALSFALLLMADDSLPFGSALSQCAYSQCGKLYLARKNPKGGPANRNYCCPEHRQLSHDAKENRGTRAKARKPK